MTKFLGLEWAPVNIPLRRRAQTAAIFTVIAIILSPTFYLVLFLWLLIFTRLWWAALMYMAWIAYDESIPKTGERARDWVRKLPIWTRCAEYFPAKLEKTADLDPTRNYILGCHPHGIIGLGIFTCFGTDGAGFSSLFPGIRSHIGTLKMNFWTPFTRELLMALGTIDVSKETLKAVLTHRPGNAAAIVVGGAQEALEAKPGSVTLVLKNRKGFVKLAIRHGIDLVPVYSFGENEIFEQVIPAEGSKLRELQLQARRHMPISMPLFYGRGIFNYTFGFMPFRRPIVIVVGKPIKVEKNPEPTPEEVSRIHSQYLEDLSNLFDEHKGRFGINDDVHLNYI